MGIHYMGENFGLDELRAYLTRYTNNVYVKVFAEKCGYTFVMDAYDDATGWAVYRFVH